MRRRIERRSVVWASACWLVLLACVPCARSQAQTDPPVELDHIVAVVGERAILQSDVDDEIRFTELESGSFSAQDDTPQRALNRLIDRALIERERSLQPESTAILPQQVQEGIANLQKNLPACAHEACATASGWSAVLRQHGFTPQQVESRVRERLQTLQFIHWRFASTLHISSSDEKKYYETVLLPQFAHNKIVAPPLGKISGQVHEILLQQKISSMLGDWLQSLRSEGEVHIVDTNYARVGELQP